jgi:O-methyltransferase
MREILKLIQSVLMRFNIVLNRANSNLGRKRHISLFEKMDYTRLATLDLLTEEILKNDVKGEIAELGVYQGEFASYLNQIFGNRSLYLFDTFSGFDERDLSVEKINRFSEGDQDFSNTSVEMVLARMKYPNKCIVKKGFFPETAKDIAANIPFAFVSIDTDLYEPIYEGLKYFYPRLTPGGYIAVHDFNNDRYAGANKAVMDFCNENKVPYVPVSDGWGSVIISK